MRAWRAGGEAPRFVRRCPGHGCEQTTRQPVPKKVVDAACEHRLGSGRVVDVALPARGGLPIAAVEVLQLWPRPACGEPVDGT